MLKRLWLILGPVFCAFLMVLALLLFYPVNYGKHQFEEEKRAAVTLTAESFKSRTQKVRALTDPDHPFIPFFGSSEWLRFDSMHPAVLAEAYQRPYRPYFLGQRGAASLTQYYGMQQILPQLEQKTAVYVVSPQWFTKRGADPSAFQQYFNSDQLTSFLTQQNYSQVDQYAARRLLDIYPNVAMADLVKKVAQKQPFSSLDQTYLGLTSRINQREEALFNGLTGSYNENYDRFIAPKLDKLPQSFSYDALMELASKEAKKHTSNNHLGIDNHFYNSRLKAKIDKLKGAQRKLSYVQSPEYNDFQLVLNQFASSKTRVLFVIPPVNEKWMAYTGLRADLYQKAVAKIKYQLESQGFHEIADFSKDGGREHFMHDTIHIGWNGWLAFDQELQNFLAKSGPAPAYQIDNRFFAKDWATYSGDIKDFKK
ncbi:D-alanyl-lipoteichoic acid biosynthesis protein DltD [Streptococcus oricebi]|uniref:Protein DltD n=1 Tax=Streptococcus oricebi TaxID=1547447 RepID=A0ABS5B5Q8_9STRE|nr:D-alanyl-lipoteichoic acid biosynthesis protein DltD [Streptococcus oricebi]MBP2624173.1 D-alanyl-lipoteichoic acid biosynthesis protein DltD [Streptococcus oricebi]